MRRIKLPPPSAFAAMLLALVIIAGWPVAAAAAVVSCDRIIKNAEKTGTPPIVTHIVDWGIITMTSALGSCKEPIEVWRARHITWIKVVKGTKVAPKIATPRIATPKTAKASALIPPVPAVEPCNRQLKNFWRQTAISIQGVRYYLFDAFTIDQDNDGVTDNLGFTLKARGKPDMVIRYFASPGQISGRDLPGIGIDNDQLVSRFCFGRADFGEPPEDITAATATTDGGGESFKLPDLAKQMERKKAGLPLDEPNPAPGQDKGKSPGLKFWIVTVASSFLFIVVIAVIVIVTKPKWEHLLKHDGDDEEGEEEEEEDV